ncbi:MAG TPA: deoxyribose-phosphate aldolase [Acidobacteriaceae bacterium]|nr:deoxyribose-phosphate aldolase [Acidobacteriaceae bacterium]
MTTSYFAPHSQALLEIEESEISCFDVVSFAADTLQNWQNLAAILDHTLLKPDANREQILHLCQEAAHYRFACAMVNPCWVALACSALAGTGIPVGTVLGFPLGASLTSTKRQEALTLLRLGAREIDMVMNVGLLKSGNPAAVHQDIHAVAEVAHEAGALVKVILETCLLSLEEKLLASELAIAAGADFIKTSTGFSTGGATVDDVSLMRGVAGGRCGVKASGGIRSFDEASAMVQAGANRIGTSSSVSIVHALGAL